MDMITRWVVTFVSVWFLLVLPVFPGIAETPKKEDRTQNNTGSEAQTDVVDKAPISQEPPSVPKVTKLKPVTVTATRIEKPITAIPNTVTIVEREAITQQTTIRDDIQSILENTVPGFGPSLRRLTGRAESLRGRNPLYLIDGVPQFNALRDGQRDGKTIDPFFLERIEVIHGSNAIQGVGATGGVVSMVTRSPRSDGTWTNLVRAGVTTHDSFDDDGFSYKLAGLSGKKFERYDVMAGATFHHRGLFFDANSDPVGLYQTQGDIMDSKSWDLFFKGGFEPDSHQRLQVMVNHFTLKRDGDFRPVVGDRATGRLTTTKAGDPSADVGDPAKNTATTLSLDYQNKALFKGELVSQFFYQDFSALYEGGKFGNFFRLTPDGPPFLDQSEIQSTKLGTKFIYAWNGLDLYNFTPSIGFDFLQDQSAQVLAKSDREWVPETTFNSYAPFTQFDKTLFDRVHLTAGVRYVMADLSVDDYTTIAASGSTFVSGGNPSFKEALPNGGMTVDLVPWLSIYGSYAEGFTMPDVGRILRAVSTPGQDVDTLLNLEPVVTRNVEFGLNFDWRRARLHVAYYRSNADLGSRLEATAAGIFNVRRQKTEIQGMDLTGSFDVTQDVTAGFTYAWIKGEFDSNKDGNVDTDLDGLNIAPNRLNLFTEINLGRGLSGRVQASHFFDRDFEGLAISREANFNGYTLVDLFIGKDTGYGQVSLGIENLLDKQYVPYFSQTESFQRNDTFFAGAGRTMTVFYQHEF